jgi:cytochrome P450
MSDGTTNQDKVPTLDFNYRADEAYLRDPWQRISQLRDEHPIFATPFEDRNIWMVSGYDQVREAFQRHDVFSSHTLNVYAPANHPDQRIIPAEIDPPLHGQFRKMILPHMAPSSIDAMEPELRQLAVELIEGFGGRGECDFIGEFAKQFPTQIFMTMMGLPLDKAEYMIRLVEIYAHQGADDESRETSLAAKVEIGDFLSKLIAERRASPRDDLISHLLTQEVDGRPVTDLELRNYSVTLYLGGLDTVAMQLGNMFLFLATNHGHRQQLLDDPSLIPAASEEMLRYFPILTPGRYVQEDVDFHGCPMKKGDRLLVSTVGAGRDPNGFDDADVVDFTRPVNRHLSFGAGPHRCVGSNLARMELVVALEEWHRRIPHYRLADDDLSFHGGGVLGLNGLRLEWDVGD